MLGFDVKFFREVYTRLVHLVEDNLLLTLQEELRFSLPSYDCGVTYNLMTTNGVQGPDGEPCALRCKIMVVTGCVNLASG